MFSYEKFIVNKLKNVLLPYLFLSTLPVVTALMLSQHHHGNIFLPSGIGTLKDYIIPAFEYYWSGQIFDAYWYIPFIMMTFLLSPMHMRFINIRLSFQVAFILALSCVSILMHRPIGNLNVFQSIVYFTPFYLIGILCSMKRVQLQAQLKGKEKYLFILIISLAVLQTYSGHTGSYHKPAFEFGGFDIMFMQKVLMCIFLMIFLNRFEKFHHKIIRAISATSFATFFIHGFIIAGISSIQIDIFRANSWLIYSLTIASIIIFCILIAKTIKYLLPNYSRLITGY